MAKVDMAKHFNTAALLRYTLPSMAMMVFTSIYSIVDGFFVSNFAGKTAFAGINLIMPFIMILGTVGFMVGSGGSALIAQARGRGDDKGANRIFSLVTYFAAFCGIILSIIGVLAMEPVALFLGADADMLPVCVQYGRINMISLTFFILQFAAQPLFSTAGKPKLGLVITVVSGLTNIVLDFVLVGVLGMGVAGAAYATVASEIVGGAASIIYFAAPNKSFLRLGAAGLDLRVIGKTCANGSSEMVANIAFSIVGIAYNWQLMNLMGENGVAAYGVIMYVGMIFSAIFEGYCMGSAPLMSYQHGADNCVEKRSLLKHGLLLMLCAGALMCVLAELLAPVVAWVFCSYDDALMELTVRAFHIYSIAFLLVGVSLFGSSLFTSLGNGTISAAISFARSLIFEVGSVFVVPMIVGAEGIWASVIIAEVASTALVAICILTLGKYYGIRQ